LFALGTADRNGVNQTSLLRVPHPLFMETSALLPDLIELGFLLSLLNLWHNRLNQPFDPTEVTLIRDLMTLQSRCVILLRPRDYYRCSHAENHENGGRGRLFLLGNDVWTDL
jgi:hypothetical protein